MKLPKETRAFGPPPRQFEPLKSDHSELSALFGDLSHEDLQRLHELRAREPELQQWIAADPERATLLRTDPERALKDLQLHLRLDDRELKARLTEVPAGWTAEVMHVRQVPPGTALMQAVWRHLNAAEANLTAFKADPLATVAAVAGVSGATSEERQAVTAALSTVLGIATLDPQSMVEWMRSTALGGSLTSTSGVVFVHRK
jgi:hypothetical protein